MRSLAKLRARYLKKRGAHAYFPQPRTYHNPRGEVYIVSMNPGSSCRSADPYVGKSPTLLNIKNRMPSWLWIAFNKSLSAVDEQDEMAMALGGGFFMKDKDREPPMKDALAVAKTYPPRPLEKLPSSVSVDRVRALLAEAASAPSETDSDWGRDDTPSLTFRSSHCGPELIEEYEWSADYLELLFAALIQLINELGLGSEGWEGIRWEVYDKVRMASLSAGMTFLNKPNDRNFSMPNACIAGRSTIDVVDVGPTMRQNGSTASSPRSGSYWM